MNADTAPQRSKAWEAGYEAGQRSGSSKPSRNRSDLWKKDFAAGYKAGKEHARWVYEDFMCVHMLRTD